MISCRDFIVSFNYVYLHSLFLSKREISDVCVIGVCANFRLSDSTAKKHENSKFTEYTRMRDVSKVEYSL